MSHYVCPKCNHKEFIFGENGGKTIAEDMNLEILGIIVSPFCKKVSVLCDRGLIPAICNKLFDHNFTTLTCEKSACSLTFFRY